MQEIEDTTPQQEPEQETASTMETAPESAENSTAEKTFSQSEVNAIIAKESSKLRRKLKQKNQQRETTTTTTPPSQQDALTDALTRVMDRLEALEHTGEQRSKEETFSSIVQDREVDPILRDLLFQTFDPKNPAQTLEKLNALQPRPEGYTSPGASPSMSKEMQRGTNPLRWTKDDIAQLQQRGTFLDEVNSWAETLPGGGNGLFKNKRKKRS